MSQSSSDQGEMSQIRTKKTPTLMFLIKKEQTNKLRSFVAFCVAVHVTVPRLSFNEWDVGRWTMTQLCQALSQRSGFNLTLNTNSLINMRNVKRGD